MASSAIAAFCEISTLVVLTKEKPSYETQNDLFIILDTLGLLKIAYRVFIFAYFLINLINFRGVHIRLKPYLKPQPIT